METIFYRNGECYGELKNPGAEGAIFEFINENTAILIFSLPGVPDPIKSNFKTAEQVLMGLLFYKRQINLVAKIGEIDWFDMIYNPRYSNPDTVCDFLFSSNKNMKVLILLVDSNLGMVVDKIIMPTSSEFHEKFKECIANKIQNDPKYNEEEEEALLEEIYEEFPTAESMALATTIRFGMKINQVNDLDTIII